MAKNTETVVSEEVSRGRGRPASFPGVDTVTMGSNIPVATKAQLTELATRRNGGKGENINVTLARIIEKAFEASERGRNQAASRRAAASDAPAE